jgi:hypothetical protein
MQNKNSISMNKTFILFVISILAVNQCLYAMNYNE